MKVRIVVILLIFVNVMFSQEKKCLDFKTGTFSYNNPALKRFKVVRKENIQIETDTVTGSIVEGSIEWKSDCNYVLTYTKITIKVLEKLLGQTINVEIANISGNTILCKTEGFGRKVDLEMTKVDN